jgi:hypothetical protein
MYVVDMSLSMKCMKFVYPVFVIHHLFEFIISICHFFVGSAQKRFANST